MLKLKNIRKVYDAGDGSVVALQSITLRFRKNEFVSILGQSGCGKTTLLNIIGGALSPDDGIISITPGAKMGYLRQHGNFESEKTIYEEFLSFFSHIIAMEETDVYETNYSLPGCT